MADEGKYHKMCLQAFVTNKRLTDAYVFEKERAVDVEMKQWFQMLCIWVEVDPDVELYTLQKFHSKMSEMAEEKNVYTV